MNELAQCLTRQHYIRTRDFSVDRSMQLPLHHYATAPHAVSQIKQVWTKSNKKVHDTRVNGSFRPNPVRRIWQSGVY